MPQRADRGGAPGTAEPRGTYFFVTVETVGFADVKLTRFREWVVFKGGTRSDRSVRRCLAHRAEIDLAGAECRDGVDDVEILTLGDPQLRHVAARQAFPDLLRRQL